MAYIAKTGRRFCPTVTDGIADGMTPATIHATPASPAPSAPHWTRLEEEMGLPPYFFSYLLIYLLTYRRIVGNVERLLRIAQHCTFLKVRSCSSTTYSNLILITDLLS